VHELGFLRVRALEKLDLELGAEFGDLRLIMAWLDSHSAYNTADVCYLPGIERGGRFRRPPAAVYQDHTDLILDYFLLVFIVLTTDVLREQIIRRL
jgi:hypothetical protein